MSIFYCFTQLDSKRADMTVSFTYFRCYLSQCEITPGYRLYIIHYVGSGVAIIYFQKVFEILFAGSEIRNQPENIPH